LPPRDLAWARYRSFGLSSDELAWMEHMELEGYELAMSADAVRNQVANYMDDYFTELSRFPARNTCAPPVSHGQAHPGLGDYGGRRAEEMAPSPDSRPAGWPGPPVMVMSDSRQVVHGTASAALLGSRQVGHGGVNMPAVASPSTTALRMAAASSDIPELMSASDDKF